MLCDRFVQADTRDYASFRQSFKLTPPQNFNFGFDVVDAIAAKTPDALALLHVDRLGQCRRFSFADIRDQSARIANMLRRQGLKKGDTVLLIMRRAYQYWPLNVALCKLGAVMIPATAQLLPHDISYRCNAASARFIICANDPGILAAVEAALPDCASVEGLFLEIGRAHV